LEGDCELFETDFRSNDRWAKEKGIRRAIEILNEWQRAEEEVKLLALEGYRFLHAQRKVLENILNVLPFIEQASAVHEILLEMGQKSVVALRQMEDGELKDTIGDLKKIKPKFDMELEELLRMLFQNENLNVEFLRDENEGCLGSWEFATRAFGVERFDCVVEPKCREERGATKEVEQAINEMTVRCQTSGVEDEWEDL